MSANTRPGSIIEITDVSEDSAWYADFILGELQRVYRVTEASRMYKAGLINILDVTDDRREISIFGAKYKVLWY